MFQIALLFVIVTVIALAGQQALRRTGKNSAPLQSYSPGEVIWVAVRFNDKRCSKDRPVVVLSQSGNRIRCLYATSQSRTESRREVVSVGAGEWDPKRRETFVNCGKTLKVDARHVRRRGGHLNHSAWQAVRRKRAALRFSA